ncbi:hypothetical protein BDP27DRAFT_1295674 [Rhodocollybia butyracea]|uniref:Uncharacterized protein n=1 Tax=Rhodocollybia butyracea TaxID=206335 RepID=A0A9P5PT69_9AGAR|nr:hypothetical protein BDP27DRAFT_1295674 [Rhodocollybia butyracea]
MLSVQARQHLLVVLIISLFGFLHVNAGQGFTDGLAIINAPSPGSPGHAGSSLPISVDVSGDGQLKTPDASNPNSTTSTHFSLLEIYLVSSQTSLNLTVSSGTGFLTQQPGSTVKQLSWPVPTCVPAGNYNLTFYETALIDGQPHFTITPVSLPVDNSNPSGISCSQTAGVTVNSLQTQPQPQSPLLQPIFPGGTLSSASAGPAFVTITLSGPLSLFTAPTTVTVTPSATPTTIVMVSMTTQTVTTTGPSGFITETVTNTAWVSTTSVTEDSDGFLPVNGASIPQIEIAWLFVSVLAAGFWIILP